MNFTTGNENTASIGKNTSLSHLYVPSRSLVAQYIWNPDKFFPATQLAMIDMTRSKCTLSDTGASSYRSCVFTIYIPQLDPDHLTENVQLSGEVLYISLTRSSFNWARSGIGLFLSILLYQYGWCLFSPCIDALILSASSFDCLSNPYSSMIKNIDLRSTRNYSFRSYYYAVPFIYGAVAQFSQEDRVRRSAVQATLNYVSLYTTRLPSLAQSVHLWHIPSNIYYS
jgi:hypothetical protein